MTRTRFAACALIVAVVLAGACTDGKVKTYKLYFLGGQSNMVGYGYAEKLPRGLDHAVDHVMIFRGRPAFDGDRNAGTGIWAPLTPGYGNGFDTDGHTNMLSDRFGPELGFGIELSTSLPDSSIALVKYALGGTGLASGVGLGSWHPTDKNGKRVNQFDHALRTLHNALSARDIDGDGVRDRLVPAGIIWMQGESDAGKDIETAEAYQDNLAQLVRSLRTALDDEHLPVVIGKITDSGMDDDGHVMDYADRVQHAQEAFAADDPCAELVRVTDHLSYVDNRHYDTDGFIELGEAFAEAVLRLEASCR